MKVTHSYNPRTQESETGDGEFEESLGYSARPCLKKAQIGKERDMGWRYSRPKDPTKGQGGPPWMEAGSNSEGLTREGTCLQAGES